MNRVMKQYQGKEIHMVLDNLPTHAFWLNQIEIWFSILAGKSLKGGSFGSVPELVAHIDRFSAS